MITTDKLDGTITDSHILRGKQMGIVNEYYYISSVFEQRQPSALLSPLLSLVLDLERRLGDTLDILEVRK